LSEASGEGIGITEQQSLELMDLKIRIGHLRIQMVLRYAHPTQDQQSKAMERFERYNATQQIGEYERQEGRPQ
jgi:hypothetical protein